jgi:hypothetical protein
VSPDLSARKAERLRAATNQPPDLVVVAPLNEWTCVKGQFNLPAGGQEFSPLVAR